MDQDPIVPQDPINPPTPPAGNPIDIAKILLPKKEVHSPASAQRVNAGALLAQEQLAGTQGSGEQAPKTPTPPPVPTEEPVVKQIETFRGDIEKLVQNKNVSVLSIAAAEAKRRSEAGAVSTTPAAPEVDVPHSLLRRSIMIVLGVCLIAVSAGALAYLLTRTGTVPLVTDTTPPAPFISVDETKVVATTPEQTRTALLNTLDETKKGTILSLGLIARLLVADASTTPRGQLYTPLTSQDMLTTIAPDAPQTLLRAMAPEYLLGVHSYQDNQPFFIFKVDSYQQAYSGMLEWEVDMPRNLAPLFTYTPRVHIPEEGLSTSSLPVAYAPTDFVDKIVENHDARVLQNEYGDIFLLWTFLDRNTLVITTNDATLREIISRIKNAPIISIPGR